MPKTIAYLRVSTTKQDVENQELELRRFADQEDLSIDEWFRLTSSSRKSPQERRIFELLDALSEGDALLVAELSRLGRSLSQIVFVVDELVRKNVRLYAIKENIRLNGSKDISTKVQISLFGLMAEIERDLISERTKAGLARAREAGVRLGRPRGSLGKSKLDERASEIKRMLEKGISKASIAKLLDVSAPTLYHFLKTRKLA